VQPDAPIIPPALKWSTVFDTLWRERTMYFSTVDLATLMPILQSSPRIRGEPHSEFAATFVEPDRVPPCHRWSSGLPRSSQLRPTLSELRRRHAMTVLG
jgi:hypothetical protein